MPLSIGKSRDRGNCARGGTADWSTANTRGRRRGIRMRPEEVVSIESRELLRTYYSSNVADRCFCIAVAAVRPKIPEPSTVPSPPSPQDTMPRANVTLLPIPSRPSFTCLSPTANSPKSNKDIRPKTTSSPSVANQCFPLHARPKTPARIYFFFSHFSVFVAIYVLPMQLYARLIVSFYLYSYSMVFIYRFEH